MDDYRRFRPISGDLQLCPFCSIFHFPFCPPPPTFSGENFQFRPNSDFPPPIFDRPFYNSSQSIGSEFFRPQPHPNPFIHEDLIDRESFRKRMRVEDHEIRVFPPFEPLNRAFSMDDQRRLNLIRDHGKEGTAILHDERHRNNIRDFRMDRDDHGDLQRHFVGSGIDHRPIHSSNTEERKEFGSDRRGLFDPQIGSGYFEKNLEKPHFSGSNEAVSVLPEDSCLADSWRSASYSSNDDKTARVLNIYDQQNQNNTRVGNFYDQSQVHPMPNSYPLLPKQYHQNHATQNYMERKSEFYNQKGDMMRNCLDNWRPTQGEVQNYPAVEHLDSHNIKQTVYTSAMADVNHVMGSQAYPPVPPQSLFPVANHVMSAPTPDHGHNSQVYLPIPPQPLFPIQTEQTFPVTSSASATISVVSSAGMNSSSKGLPAACGSQSLTQGEFYTDPPLPASNGFSIESSRFIHQPSSNLDERGPSLLLKNSLKEKPVYVDAAHLLKQPYRASRPNHIVIILRGLPGSGKSYLAKAIRDIEVENGGNAPRIHAMDDYFMIEVEKKLEDTEGLKSSGSIRSKKQITKKVIEYCYEPEMEEAYRSSMLKAFKKTIDDGIFNFVIVDDRNLRVADFAQFWAVAKRSGYEVYLLEATYKDPAGCAARNIHGFKLADIQKMAEQWEEAPPLYLHLDIQSLLGGDDLKDQSIEEVDMDADDAIGDMEAHHLTDDCNSTELKSSDQENDHRSTKFGKRWSTEEEELVSEKNELLKNRWTKDLSVDLHDSESAIGSTSVLSGLIQAYGKGVNAVHWGDKIESSGFSIGFNKKQCASSLIIGQGAGYNLKSNPLLEDDTLTEPNAKINSETKSRFNEQLRAERESFRAVFDRRRKRVGGLLNDDNEP